ncbi:hypothetical protein D4S03_10185 [bacterium]|nr:MAG: hypothetical protein D4S03_10185 [bacterium]
MKDEMNKQKLIWHGGFDEKDRQQWTADSPYVFGEGESHIQFQITRIRGNRFKITSDAELLTAEIKRRRFTTTTDAMMCCELDNEKILREL